MFCICSTKTANTLRSVLVSASSMVELLLQRFADAAQHRLGDVAAIGEDDPLLVQPAAQIQELRGKHRRSFRNVERNPRR